MSPTFALLMGGEARHTATQFERRDPVTGKVATQAAAATIADAIAAAEAAEAAEAAFPGWSARANKRRAMLTGAAAALEGRASDFV